jgi:hypothetical protein
VHSALTHHQVTAIEGINDSVHAACSGRATAPAGSAQALTKCITFFGTVRT